MSELSELEGDDEEEHCIVTKSWNQIAGTEPEPEIDIAEELVESSERDFTRLKWKKGDFTPNIHPFLEVPANTPTNLLTPIEYFKTLIRDEMIDMLVKETNMYSFQKTGECINTNKPEIEKVLWIYLRMGLCQIPSVRSYWETNMAYSLVSEVMPRNRFQKLVTCLHMKNNLSVTDEEKKISYGR